MASNLASIGFDFADADSFQRRMLELAAQTIERLDCEFGDYAIWRSRAGAEIWFHLGLFGDESSARDIAGLTPFYEGSSEVALEITQRLKRPDDNAFEGAFAARLVGPSGATGEALTFDAVDFAAHAGRTVPFQCHARLVGFARRVTVVDAHSGSRMAGQPHAQAGETAAFEAAGTASRMARLTGRVAEVRHLVNEAATADGQPGAAFVAMLVDRGDVSIDIVADPRVVEGAISEGTIVRVECGVFGRLLD